MVDLSKAEPSRNFRNSYLLKYDRIIDCIQRQREEFVSYLDQCDIYRKKRSAIIEGEVVPLLKSLDIKPSKPLGKFDNDGLIEELTRLIKENPDKDTEAIEIALVKIKNRYCDIANITKTLEMYAQRIDNYPDEGHEAKMEDDYLDEIVIDLTAKKFQTRVVDYPETVKENEDILEFSGEEMERVVETHEASPELLETLSEIFGEEDNRIDLVDEDQTAPISLQEIDLSTLKDKDSREDEIDDFANQIATLAEELKAGLDETNIVSFLSKDEEPVEDYAFTISNNISLQDLVKHVYEGTDDESYDSALWECVYNFSTNKEIIDEVADSLGVSVEEVVKTPGLLNKVTLRFPTELTTYEEIETNNEVRRAA